MMSTLALGLVGCSTIGPAGPRLGTAPSPAEEWTPPAGVLPPVAKAAPAPILPVEIQPGMTISLEQVIEIALANNTTTRTAWLDARAAAAGLGSARAEELPEVEVAAALTRSRSAQGGGRAPFIQSTTSPSIALTFLLFDFGGRPARIAESRFALIAANLAHNQAVQDVILQTEEAYYGYLDVKALLSAQESTIRERKTSLEAAQARHDAGVATIADVLQAKTALSQAELTREALEGSVRTIEGSLATTMGLPPTTRFDFGELPIETPTARVDEAVEGLIEKAVAARPDLAAARAQAEQAEARVRATRAEGKPNLSFAGAVGETFFGTSTNAAPYSASLLFRWPLFTGFRNRFDIRQAQIEADAAREQIRAVEQQVQLEVWSSAFALRTAAQRLTTARDLLASAQQSAEVARSRYRTGVGSILDVLTAEAALENARAQEVQSRADWFLSVARLAHDTGSLRVGKGTNEKP